MRRALQAMLLSTALLLGGCDTVMMGAAPGILKADRVNLMNASYAAADTLVQQTQRKLPPGTVLVVPMLQEIIDQNKERPVASPKLGSVITHQLRERFIQLGYDVKDGSGGTAKGAQGAVTGTYGLRDDHFLNSGTLMVALKMMDARTGKIVGSYDYSLPITYDIRKYMKRDEESLTMPAIPPVL